MSDDENHDQAEPHRVEKHSRFPGFFILRGKLDVLATRSTLDFFNTAAVPSTKFGHEQIEAKQQRTSIYLNEHVLRGRPSHEQESGQHDGHCYRGFNPFRSHLAAAIVGGIEQIAGVRPGGRVLYIGPSLVQTATFIADVVGGGGSNKMGKIFCIATERDPKMMFDPTDSGAAATMPIELPATRVAQHAAECMPGVMAVACGGAVTDPCKAPFANELRSHFGIVNLSQCLDGIIVDIPGSREGAVEALCAVQHLLKPDTGRFMLLVDANSTEQAKGNSVEPQVVYANCVAALRQHGWKPLEQITLEPFHSNKAVLIGKLA